MAVQFCSGWTPEHAAQGLRQFEARGRVFAAAPHSFGDDRMLPRGFSLSGWLRWAYNQGQVGSCFANMMAHILQLMTVGAVANGAKGKVFNPSRHMVWWQTRKLDGSLGSRADGGSIVNSFASCGDPPDGIGDCSEELCPYQPDHAFLEQAPSAEAIKSAGETRIEQINSIDFDPAQWKRHIFNLRPIGIGIWWPGANGGPGWDQGLIDEHGRTTGIQGGAYGHALAVIGWLDGWDGHDYLEILNSHGPIYGIPPADVQKDITGYKPTSGEKSFSFWARTDLLSQLCKGNSSERVVAADVRGYVPQQNNVADFINAFPF